MTDLSSYWFPSGQGVLMESTEEHTFSLFTDFGDCHELIILKEKDTGWETRHRACPLNWVMV